jgi:hypothetical protein
MLSNNSSRKRQCRQLELRVPELPSYPEERVLPALQGEVADKGPTATIIARAQSIHSLCNAAAP